MPAILGLEAWIERHPGTLQTCGADIPEILGISGPSSVDHCTRALHETISVAVRGVDLLIEEVFLERFGERPRHHGDIFIALSLIQELPPERGFIEAAVNLPLLGIGAWRVALRLAPGLALKISLIPHASQFNETEEQIWKDASPELARWLVPVIDIAHDGRWILMNEVDRIDMSVAGTGQLISCAIAAIESLDPDLCASVDLSDYNFGLSDGKVVLLDYGND
jgi:hypothetical protein